MCMVVHRGGFRRLHVLDFRHPLCRIVHWRGVFRCGAGGPFAQAGGELGERCGGFFEDGQRGSKADGGKEERRNRRCTPIHADPQRQDGTTDGHGWTRIGLASKVGLGNFRKKPIVVDNKEVLAEKL